MANPPHPTHAHRCIILLRQASRDTRLPKTSINGDYQAPICWRFFTLSKRINSCVLSICQPSVVRQCAWLGGVYATVLRFWGVKPPPPPRQRHARCPPEGPRAAVVEDGRWGIGSVLTTASSEGVTETIPLSGRSPFTQITEHLSVLL